MTNRRSAALVLALLLAAGCSSLLAVSGCACRSTYWRSCGRMSWEEMCRKDRACRACMRDGEEARACWERINGKAGG